MHNIHGKTVHRCFCWQVIGLSFIAFFLLLMKSISLPSTNFSPWKRVPVKLKQDSLFLTFPSVQGNVSMKLLPKQWFSNHLIIYIIGMITEITYQMLKLTYNWYVVTACVFKKYIFLMTVAFYEDVGTMATRNHKIIIWLLIRLICKSTEGRSLGFIENLDFSMNPINKAGQGVTILKLCMGKNARKFKN